jgi:DNA repair protein RadA/Sms
MARPESRYVCGSCGEVFLRWEGQCRTCGTWNSLVETVVRTPKGAARPRNHATNEVSAAVPLASIGLTDAPRVPVGIGELDRVLGGGLVRGSVVLLGGEPGIGKSTLMLQALAAIVGSAAGGPDALYATGEESTTQVHLRAGRLGVLAGAAGERIRILAEHDIGSIVAAATSLAPAVLVVDSVQTATVDELDGAAGSVGQVREATVRLMAYAKATGTAVILAGHVTKDGTIAGPKTLEHLVDVVLNLEGERYAALRLIRASKNRFGSTEEVGVFEMGEAGLREVTDPARAFLADHDRPAPGSVVAATLEGSRPLLVEVQALVSPARFGTPVRRASGLDINRLGLLVAVLGRRAGIGLGSHDVYANLAGGLAVAEPGMDLPLALALASSLRDRPVITGTVAIGEVGLLGELRTVAGLERRLREAARLGFTRAIVPRPSRGAETPSVPSMEIVLAATLSDAIGAALAKGTPERGEPVATMLG